MENKEFEYQGMTANGFLMLFLLVILIPGALLLWLICDLTPLSIAIAAVIGIIDMICWGGFFVQEPNESRVMIFFGKYKGTCRVEGYLWVNPLMQHKKVSLRIRNMDIAPIKVNDKAGNPVMIGMVLVWKIRDTYRVVFDLDTGSGVAGNTSLNSRALEEFVRIQSDAALREVTSQFAYDSSEISNTDITLRDGGPEINSILEQKLNDRLAMAGIEIVEARINYLAYAPEIAAVMLRRQQASAVIMAREKIVEGAVSMVEMALTRIEQGGQVKLDQAEKAKMVSSLMVVLCTDEPVTPVLNTQS